MTTFIRFGRARVGLVLCAAVSLAACSGTPATSSTTPVAVSTPTVAFPTTAIGQNASATVTVSSTAAATIGITSSDTADFPFSTTCAPALSAGSSCLVTVRFQPSEAGNLSAWLTIQTTDGAKTTVSLSGTATGFPTTSTVDPSVLSFQVTTPLGNPFYLAPGQSAQLAAAIIENGGQNEDVTSSAAWTSSDVTVTSVSSAGLVTAIGSGTTNISAWYQGHTASIRAIVVGTVTIAPRSFTFAPTGVGQQSSTETFTITYNGPNLLGSISSSDPIEFSVDRTTCDEANAHSAGYTCTFDVTFNPMTTGTRSAQIAVATAQPAPGAVSTVTVSGIGQ